MVSTSFNPITLRAELAKIGIEFRMPPRRKLPSVRYEVPMRHRFKPTNLVSYCFKEEVWLPGMDSNHDSRLQRPLSYH
jgi:hypothetical protein